MRSTLGSDSINARDARLLDPHLGHQHGPPRTATNPIGQEAEPWHNDDCPAVRDDSSTCEPSVLDQVNIWWGAGHGCSAAPALHKGIGPRYTHRMRYIVSDADEGPPTLTQAGGQVLKCV